MLEPDGDRRRALRGVYGDGRIGTDLLSNLRPQALERLVVALESAGREHGAQSEHSHYMGAKRALRSKKSGPHRQDRRPTTEPACQRPRKAR